MTTKTICNICNTENELEKNINTYKINSNVERFKEERFTVWRCKRCQSLHSLEEIDYNKYYENYPIHNQKIDLPTKILFHSRLNQIIKFGLKKHHSLLDYGCGNGSFVKYLQSRGYKNTQGYDPFSVEFNNKAICEKKYDFVISQDVIEHAPDPKDFLEELAKLVQRPGGKLIIGTPNATYIDPSNAVDQKGHLHQPFHRHILSDKYLQELLQQNEFVVERVIKNSYVNTKIPFINFPFVFNYLKVIDGTVEDMFKPFKASVIASSPKLLYKGFFGGFQNNAKDMVVGGTAV